MPEQRDPWSQEPRQIPVTRDESPASEQRDAWNRGPQQVRIVSADVPRDRENEPPAMRLYRDYLEATPAAPPEARSELTAALVVTGRMLERHVADYGPVARSGPLADALLNLSALLAGWKSIRTMPPTRGVSTEVAAHSDLPG